MLREAIPLFDLPKDEPWSALASSILGIALARLGNIDDGLAQVEEALARQHTYGENWATASACGFLGEILVAKGEYRRAATLFAQAARNWSAPDITGFVLWPLAGLAELASLAGRAIDAARLIGLHDAVAGEASAAITPYYAQLVARATETASQQLGASIFAAERDAARIIPVDGLVSEALRIASNLATDA